MLTARVTAFSSSSDKKHEVAPWRAPLATCMQTAAAASGHPSPSWTRPGPQENRRACPLRSSGFCTRALRGPPCQGRGRTDESRRTCD
eukprot:359467-Chlamydomonas_euryale.AAC.2